MSQAAALPPAVVFDVEAVSSLSFEREDGLASMGIVVSALNLNGANIFISLGCQPGLACRQDFHRWMVTTCACRLVFL